MSHLQDVAPTTRLADTALRSKAEFAKPHLTSLNCSNCAPQVPEGDCEAVDAQYKSSGAAQAHVSTAASKADAAVKVSAAQGEELCTCRDHTFQIRVYVLHTMHYLQGSKQQRCCAPHQLHQPQPDSPSSMT